MPSPSRRRCVREWLARCRQLLCRSTWDEVEMKAELSCGIPYLSCIQSLILRISQVPSHPRDRRAAKHPQTSG